MTRDIKYFPIIIIIQVVRSYQKPQGTRAETGKFIPKRIVICYAIGAAYAGYGPATTIWNRALAERIGTTHRKSGRWILSKCGTGLRIHPEVSDQ
jgi:hypothetical protein